MESCTESLLRKDSGEIQNGKLNSTRQRKLPKTASDSCIGSKPILQRLENNKPAPLVISTIQTQGGAEDLPGSEAYPCLPDSSKPLPAGSALHPSLLGLERGEGGEMMRDADLAGAAGLTALLLGLAAAFLDMDMIIIQAIALFIPHRSQEMVLDWARSASLEVAMWSSCSVVEACLVWGVFVALYSEIGAALGFLPGLAAGYSVAVARFRTQPWAEGTMLNWMPAHMAAVMSGVVILVCFVISYYLDARKRSHSRVGNSNGNYKYGWCSPQALMSLRVSPMTRFPMPK